MFYPTRRTYALKSSMHLMLLMILMPLLLPFTIRAQNALNFDGGNDIVQTTYPGVLGSANRTFEAWVNISPSATANTAITDYGLNVVGSRNTFLVTPSRQLGYISGGTNANIFSSSNTVPVGQWVHVAFVLSSGTGFLYVNGVQVGTGNLTTVNTPSGNANLRIGQRVSGASIPMLGSIDEVRIWDVARTPAQIQADMNTEFCVIPASLRAYYKFNQGTAGGTNTGLTTLDDNSGNGNDGTLTGFSLSGSTSNWVTGAMLTSSSLMGGTDTLSGCVPFLTPGNQTLTSSGIYPDTVQSISGCDSIYSLDFTALSATASTISPTACFTYTAPSGAVYTSSGMYSDTIVNHLGCDSIITINLTIAFSTVGILNAMACDTFISPGGDTLTSTGSYQDTILNVAGCDSIITILLEVNTSATTIATDSSCGPFTSGLGNTYTTSGTYTENTQTIHGCDSTITLNLTVINTDTTVTQTGTTLTANQSGATYQWYDCGNQSAIAGATSQAFTPTVSGSYFVEIQNGICTDSSACDSVLIVGIRDFDRNAISLYPNPTSGTLSIDLGDRLDFAEVRVMNAAGKIEQALVVSNTQHLQLELGVAQGLYMVQVYTEAGYQTFRVLKME